MKNSKQRSRRIVFSVFLALAGACGDDGGEDGFTPGDDAAIDNDGGMLSDDAAVPMDDGSIDGGGGDPDASSDLDATVVVDATVGDASIEELQAALDQAGVRTDLRRAALVFAQACERRALCAPGEDANACAEHGLGEYQDGVSAGYSEACLDTTLDLYSCFASAGCDFDMCEDIAATAFELCPQTDAGMMF